MEKLTLKEYRELEPQEQVNLINQYSEGKRTLKQIEEEFLAFTNLGKQLPEGAVWDSKEKKCVYIQQPTTTQLDVKKSELTLSDEEILELKKLLQGRKLLNDIPTNEEIKKHHISVYEQSYSEFMDWCKKNRLLQKEALYLATQLLMQTYQK